MGYFIILLFYISGPQRTSLIDFDIVDIRWPEDRVQRGVTVLCFYLFISAGRGGTDCEAAKSLEGTLPVRYLLLMGSAGVRKGQRWRAMGKNPEGAFVPGGKTQCLRERSAEKMCQGEKRNRKGEKKKKKPGRVVWSGGGGHIHETQRQRRKQTVKANRVQRLTFTTVKQRLSFHFSSHQVCTFSYRC